MMKLHYQPSPHEHASQALADNTVVLMRRLLYAVCLVLPGNGMQFAA